MDNANGLEERYFPDLAVVTAENEGVVFLKARWVFDAWVEAADGAVYAEGRALLLADLRSCCSVAWNLFRQSVELSF